MNKTLEQLEAELTEAYTEVFAYAKGKAVPYAKAYVEAYAARAEAEEYTKLTEAYVEATLMRLQVEKLETLKDKINEN